MDRVSVERLPESGNKAGIVLAVGVLALALATAARCTDPAPVVQQVTPPQPLVTLVVEDPHPGDDALHRLGRRWSGVFDAVLSSLPVPMRQHSGVHAAAVVAADPRTGRRSGVLWRDDVMLGTAEEWLLEVEVSRRPPARSLDPCLPEAWGRVGATVLRCEVVTQHDGSVLLRAATVPAGVAAHSTAPGWSYVVQVRNGSEHVQVMLTRLTAGSESPPVTEDDVARIAVQPAWRSP